MDTATLNLILWIPFGLVVLLSSIRFAISGFRRGIWLALVYLAISLAAAAVAVPLARTIAPTTGTLGTTVTELLPFTLPGGEASLEGVVQMLGALLLYPLVFFLLALIARVVAGLLLRPLITSKKPGARMGGLVVGVVHAVVYPLLLLLPLYGTMAAFMPAVEVLAQAGDAQDSEGYSYVCVITEHPVVKLSGTQVAQWYYKGLSSVELEGAALDLAGVSNSAQELVTQFQQFQEADPAQRKVMLPGLLEVLENTLNTKWCYQLVCQVGLDTVLDSQDIPVLGQWILSLKGTSRQDYNKTVDALMVLIDGLHADGTLDLLLAGDDLSGLLEEPLLLPRLDTFLESTAQTLALKQILFTESVAEVLFGGDKRAAQVFVTQVLAEPKTQGLLTLTTVGALAEAETTADAARVLLENAQIDMLALAGILAQNDLFEKLEPDFAALLPSLG